MKKLFVKFVVFFSMVIASSGLAQAGTESHGGGGILCAGPKGVSHVTLLDLFEQGERPENENTSPLSVEEWIEYGFKNLAPFDPVLVFWAKQALEIARHNIRTPPIGMTLAAPRDTAIEFLPNGCSLIGVARWNDETNSVMIDASVLKKMSARNQAALWVHESVYKVLRVFLAETDSVRARSLVRMSFPLKNLNYTHSNSEDFKTWRLLPLSEHLSLSDVAKQNWTFVGERQNLENACGHSQFLCEKGAFRALRLAAGFIGFNISNKDTLKKRLADYGLKNTLDVKQWSLALALMIPDSAYKSSWNLGLSPDSLLEQAYAGFLKSLRKLNSMSLYNRF
jgi:hypothetical protein